MHKYSSEIRRLMLDEMSHRNASNFSTYILCITHTSKINNLCSSLNSKEMLQNFLYLLLYEKKTQAVFSIFHFEQL